MKHSVSPAAPHRPPPMRMMKMPKEDSPFAPALHEDEAIEQAKILRVLADPVRLRIAAILASHGGEVCVHEITENFSLVQPSISHHLRIMRDGGFLRVRKHGLHCYYYLRSDVLARALSSVADLVDLMKAAQKDTETEDHSE